MLTVSVPQRQRADLMMISIHHIVYMMPPSHASYEKTPFPYKIFALIQPSYPDYYCYTKTVDKRCQEPPHKGENAPRYACDRNPSGVIPRYAESTDIHPLPRTTSSNRTSSAEPPPVSAERKHLLVHLLRSPTPASLSPFSAFFRLHSGLFFLSFLLLLLQ